MFGRGLGFSFLSFFLCFFFPLSLYLSLFLRGSFLLTCFALFVSRRRNTPAKQKKTKKVLSRASGQEKSTEAYFGLNLISDPRGRSTILSHATASREWKWVRKAVAPAFSQAAMKAGFEAAIRPSAEAAADALARVCGQNSGAPSPSSPPSSSEEGGGGGGVASVNVDDLAAATAMDVITAFGFGVRSNAVERLGAELAERERTKKESHGEGGGHVGGAKASLSGFPIPVPDPLIPGAEDTVEAMHAATEAAELYVFRFLLFFEKTKRIIDFFPGFFLPLIAPALTSLSSFKKKSKIGKKNIFF